MKRRILLVVAALAVLVSIGLGSLDGRAQCVTSYVFTGTGTDAGNPYKYGVKYLSGTYACTLTASGNVAACNPDPSASSSRMLATALPGAIGPYCHWACVCGQVTFDQSDGLPVELMEFTIVEAEQPDTWSGTAGTEEPPQQASAPTSPAEIETESEGTGNDEC